MARKPIPFSLDGHMLFYAPLRVRKQRATVDREAKPFQTRLRYRETYERGYVFLDDMDKRFYVEADRLGNMIPVMTAGVVEGTFDFINMGGTYFSIYLVSDSLV